MAAESKVANDQKYRTFEAGIAQAFGDFSELCGHQFILQIATIHKIPTLISWDFFLPAPPVLARFRALSS
jgi:hypothetical protein